MRAQQPDPVTIKVIWDRLIAITQDAAATMVRTAFSPIVREGNDYCCSLIDTNGRQLAEPPHTLPSFTGTLPFTVRHFLKKYPLEQLRPGDSIVTNDPWLGTGHSNDFNIATPIFDSRGRAVAIASSVAHMSDIGGSINFGETRDVLEEGLRVPIAKIVREGVLNEELMEFIAFNVRMPEECMGDLSGILAANATMGERLLELLDDAGISDFVEMSREIQKRSEEAMVAAIRELPEGRYEGSAGIDGAGYPVLVKATVEIKDGRVDVDFSGSSPQNNLTSLNVPMNYTYAFTVYPLKLLIHPRLPGNDGCLRPLNVSAPSGSILNAQWPAAVFCRNYTGHMISCALFSALEHALPDRVWAHSGSAPSGLDCVMGTHPSGKPFVHMFFSASGGTGAMPSKDGETCNFPTNARCTSVEASERRAPIRFDRKELVTDSAGSGKYRGGLGGSYTIRNVGPSPIIYSTLVGRLHEPARGLAGGNSGSLNDLFLKGVRQTRGAGRWELQPGDTFTKVSPGGGGLGNPEARDRASVLEDVREGYLSIERARRDYGVEVSDSDVKTAKES